MQKLTSAMQIFFWFGVLGGWGFGGLGFLGVGVLGLGLVYGFLIFSLVAGIQQ